MRFGKFIHLLFAADLELNTMAFAPPFAHIPFIPVGRTKECQECAYILLQVGSTFKKVPLTTHVNISPRARVYRQHCVPLHHHVLLSSIFGAVGLFRSDIYAAHFLHGLAMIFLRDSLCLAMT